MAPGPDLVERPGGDPLTDYAGESAVQVRFHFAGPGLLWAVDDVTVTARVATPVPGGILTGTVTDANTGKGLIGATVRTGGPDGSAADGRHDR
ncbi:hypothetical protein ACFQ3Z_00725 [Streptomyces nogalater]